MTIKERVINFVTVTEHTLNNGYSHDKEQAKKYLEVGKKYEVVETRVFDWYTNVWLREFPGLAFNSVHFVPYEEVARLIPEAKEEPEPVSESEEDRYWASYLTGKEKLDAIMKSNIGKCEEEEKESQESAME